MGGRSSASGAARSVPRSSLPLAVEARIAKEVAAYTMLHPEALSATIHHTIATIDAGIEGDVVECGTWKGGASFSMLLAQRYKYRRIVKPIWMFDSFQGLPPADERDGRIRSANDFACAWMSKSDAR